MPRSPKRSRSRSLRRRRSRSKSRSRRASASRSKSRSIRSRRASASRRKSCSINRRRSLHRSRQQYVPYFIPRTCPPATCPPATCPPQKACPVCPICLDLEEPSAYTLEQQARRQAIEKKFDMSLQQKQQQATPGKLDISGFQNLLSKNTSQDIIAQKRAERGLSPSASKVVLPKDVSSLFNENVVASSKERGLANLAQLSPLRKKT